MMELLLFVAAALLLLWFLVFWNPRKKSLSRAHGSVEVSQAQQALAALRLELLPTAFIDRVFSAEDRDFIAHQAPPHVLKMFQAERKAIALAWLRRTRAEAARLMNFHLRLARSEFDLSPAVEFRLGVDYVCLLVVSQAMSGIVRMGGPHHAYRIVGHTVGLASRLCSLSGNLLGALELAAESNARGRLTGTSTPS